MRHWVFFALAATSLVWACLLLWHAWPDLERNLPRMALRWLLLTFIGTLASAYLAFEAFRELLERLRPGAFGRLQLAHLYFTAQLMKHLPGRVWGVAYQSSTGTGASIAEWIAINATYMLLSTAFALASSTVLLAWWYAWSASALVLAAALALYFGLWQRAPMRLVLDLLQRVPKRSFTRLADALAPFVAVEARFKVRVFGLLATSWVLYFLAWGCFGLAWPGLDLRNGIVLCALYTLAWFAGYISFLTPSGIGVRELVFVLLAHNFPADAITAMAILGRMILLLVDIAFGLAFSPFTRVRPPT